TLIPLDPNLVTYTFTGDANGAGNGLKSDIEGPLHAGDYIFQAHFAGNADYIGSARPMELLHINLGTITLATMIFNAADNKAIALDVNGVAIAPLGTSVYDTVTTGAAPFALDPNLVTYTFTGDPNGAGQGVKSDTEGPLHAGDYVFQAHFAGNADYKAADSPVEPLHINQGTNRLVTTNFTEADNK